MATAPQPRIPAALVVPLAVLAAASFALAALVAALAPLVVVLAAALAPLVVVLAAALFPALLELDVLAALAAALASGCANWVLTEPSGLPSGLELLGACPCS